MAQATLVPPGPKGLKRLVTTIPGKYSAMRLESQRRRACIHMSGSRPAGTFRPGREPASPDDDGSPSSRYDLTNCPATAVLATAAKAASSTAKATRPEVAESRRCSKPPSSGFQPLTDASSGRCSKSHAQRVAGWDAGAQCMPAGFASTTSPLPSCTMTGSVIGSKGSTTCTLLAVGCSAINHSTASYSWPAMPILGTA